ncbi:MAG TPA: molybdopterin dinucleotide binding domain-containing protein, partial [Burkholderiaceae bacterium]|nr:molybdopterin dinucleotide binding domain-containing protein [Burkholderiaceae bacterium]
VHAATPGQARLYEDGRFPTPSGRARFADVAFQAPIDTIDARYPIRLTTGRLRDQWHGMSRTGTIARAFGHAPTPSVQLHPADATRLGFAPGDLVHVTSRHGSLVLPVEPSPSIAPMQAFIAMHWGAEFVHGTGQPGVSAGGVNTLTTSAFDPTSRQPELKHAAIRLLPARLPWRWVAFGWFDAADVLRAWQALRQYFLDFAYATCTPFGHDETRIGLSFRGACAEPVSHDVIAALERVFRLDAPDVLRYDDTRRGTRRRVRLRGESIDAVALGGDASAADWLRDYLESGASVRPLGRALLMPARTPPIAHISQGRCVCNCLGVSESQINALLERHEGDEQSAFEALQTTLKCGSSCGSCKPELRRLAQAAARRVPAA